MTCGMVICKLQVSLTCFSLFFFVMQLLKGAIQLKHDVAGLLKEGGKTPVIPRRNWRTKKKRRCISAGYKLHLKA